MQKRQRKEVSTSLPYLIKSQVGGGLWELYSNHD